MIKCRNSLYIDDLTANRAVARRITVVVAGFSLQYEPVARYVEVRGENSYSSTGDLFVLSCKMHTIVALEIISHITLNAVDQTFMLLCKLCDLGQIGVFLLIFVLSHRKLICGGLFTDRAGVCCLTAVSTCGFFHVSKNVAVSICVDNSGLDITAFALAVHRSVFFTGRFCRYYPLTILVTLWICYFRTVTLLAVLAFMKLISLFIAGRIYDD